MPASDETPTDPTSPEPPPNGPARVTIDNKKERFKLDYGGQIILQTAVKLTRDGSTTSFRDAGARLFVLSKFDGWDVVTQTIRIAAVGAQPGDTISIDAAFPIIEDALATELSDDDGAPCVYCPTHDWLLTVDTGPSTDFAIVDAPVKGASDIVNQRIALTATGPEVMLRFRPYYRQRHQPQ